MILYAPIIEPSIPAFSLTTTTIDEQEYYIGLKIGFQHNIAVAETDVGGIVCLIKDVNTGKIISKDGFAISIDWNTSTCTANIVFLPDQKPEDLILGNFYKIQIAYVDKAHPSTIGPYSTVGITRYLGASGRFELGINDLKLKETNKNRIKYKGTYSYNGNGGVTESVYQYRFECTEKTADGSIIPIEDSGWLLPVTDSNSNIVMEYILRNEHEYLKTYDLTFSVLTVNGYQTAVTYQIARTGLYPSLFHGELIAEQDAAAKENGYVRIYIASNNDTLTTGTFRLIRKTEYSSNWDELTRFNMSVEDDVSIFSWKDYSVEQGQKYYYAIQQYGEDSTGIPYYSTMAQAIINAVEFEHMFLGDDMYQLKLAYNPQVSSFKETVLESKTDVIGGKYPFFFRNGNVRYKEIPISGLLSYFLDDEGCFLNTLNVVPASLGTGSAAARSRTNSEDKKPAEGFIRTTNLVNHNFASERQFKLAVLNWLNNGKPKLFRSPAEGNYVIRLMNISMSPNTQLGRMLHTVSATGYEVMVATPLKMLEQKVMSFEPIYSNFDGVNDGGFGNLVANGKYEYRTNNISDLDPDNGLIQLCALMSYNPLDTTQTIRIQYRDSDKEDLEAFEDLEFLPKETKTYHFDTPPAYPNITIRNTSMKYGVYGFYI